MTVGLFSEIPFRLSHSLASLTASTDPPSLPPPLAVCCSFSPALFCIFFFSLLPLFSKFCILYLGLGLPLPPVSSSSAALTPLPLVRTAELLHKKQQRQPKYRRRRKLIELQEREEKIRGKILVPFFSVRLPRDPYSLPRSRSSSPTGANGDAMRFLIPLF